MDIKAYIASGVLEAWVFGSLTGEEAAQVAADVAHNPELAGEVAAIEASLLKMAATTAAPPPDGLDETIWAAINSVQDNQSAQGQVQTVSAVNRTIPFFPTAVSGTRWSYAAMLALLAGSLVLNLVFWLQYSAKRHAYAVVSRRMDTVMQQQEQLSQIVAGYTKSKDMMADTGMQTVVLHTVLKGHPMAATLYYHREKNEAWVMMDALPEPPDGMQYQLWAIKDGKPMDMGVLPNNMAGKPAMAKVTGTMIEGQAFAISLEKAGGNPVPTTENIYVMGKA